jgi:putative cell wall-binding protein
VRLGLSLAIALGIMAWVPAAAVALQNSDIPGIPLTPQFSDTLATPSLPGQYPDVWRVHVKAGERLTFTLSHDPTIDCEIDIWATPATDFSGFPIWSSNSAANPQVDTWFAPNDGWFYVVIYAAGPGSGSYTLKTDRWWIGPVGPATPQRLWGSDRYTTAVQIAEKNFPGWLNCDHVIIASGEDRAAADPLAASGLTWTYGAPIMLVQTERVPPEVMNALAAIRSVNNTLTVHVVGGPVSVPDARLAEIAASVPGVNIDRIAPYSDRFVLAGAIARRMSTERPGGWHRTNGYNQFALIANGADPDKFFDALALSPLAASTGYPILLVNEDSVPAATQSALNDLGIQARIVGGGPATVSDDVLTDLASGGASVQRWWGNDRYSTATNIANEALGAPPAWIQQHNVGVTAKLPDALTGGAFTGLRNSPVVLTQTDALPSATSQFLHTHTAQIGECYTLGGPVSITDPTNAQISGALIP